MKRKTNKTIVTILISLVCALILVGGAIAIYDYASNRGDSGSEWSDDDGWTDNY